jgi:hypothetical protein
VRWLFAALSFAFFSCLVDMWRYFLPTLPWVVLATCDGLPSIFASDSAPSLARRAQGALAGLTVVVGLMACASYVLRESVAMTGGFLRCRDSHSDADYLTSMSKARPIELGSYPIMAQVNERPPLGRVLLLGDSVHAYLTVPHDNSFALNAPSIVQYLSDPEQTARALLRAGFSHILFHPAEWQRISHRGTLELLTPDEERRVTDFLRSPWLRCVMGDCGGRGPVLLEIVGPRP